MHAKLRAIRKERKITLKELGLKVGRSKQYMSMLERGEIRLTYDMAVKISSVFGLTPDDLFLPIESNNLVLDDRASA